MSIPSTVASLRGEQIKMALKGPRNGIGRFEVVWQPLAPFCCFFACGGCGNRQRKGILEKRCLGEVLKKYFIWKIHIVNVAVCF